MLTTQKAGRGIVLALIATCAALGTAAVGTHYIVSSQGDVAGRATAQTQQVAQLARFPAQLAATEADFRTQAAVPRGTLTARFTQAMSQLDAAANAIARTYPEGSATRVQFSNLYGDLRSRYDAAHRALSEDLAGNRRSSDYFVVHADGINQASQALSAAATGLMEDQLRQMPLQAEALANAGSRMLEMWMLAGLAVLGIMCAYGLVVARSAGKAMRLADAARERRGAPAAAIVTAKEAPAEVVVARPAVAAADLPRLIDEAIPTALADELKTGVLFIAMTNLDTLRLDHTAEEIEDLQIGVRDSIAAALRPSDVVARLGDGEYGILLAEMRQRSDFVPIEQRIRRAITFAQMRFPQFAGKNIALRSNSAMYPIDGYRGDDLLRSARAMGQAKGQGSRERTVDATPLVQAVAPQIEPPPEAAPGQPAARKPIDRSDRDDIIFT